METMVKEQREYLEAKEIFLSVQKEHDELEAEFCRKLGVVNDSGEVPVHVWDIDDEEICNKAIDDFGRIVEENGMEARLNDAREDLRYAENDLINYLVGQITSDNTPEKALERAELRTMVAQAKNNVLWRDELLKAAMKLKPAGKES